MTHVPIFLCVRNHRAAHACPLLAHWLAMYFGHPPAKEAYRTLSLHTCVRAHALPAHTHTIQADNPTLKLFLTLNAYRISGISPRIANISDPLTVCWEH